MPDENTVDQAHDVVDEGPDFVDAMIDPGPNDPGGPDDAAVQDPAPSDYATDEWTKDDAPLPDPGQSDTLDTHDVQADIWYDLDAVPDILIDDGGPTDTGVDDNGDEGLLDQGLQPDDSSGPDDNGFEQGPDIACTGPKDCDDSNMCTIDLCDSGTGECSHIPLNCDDGCDCTIDGCDTSIGCVYEAAPGCEICDEDKDCDDGDPCTVDNCYSSCFCGHEEIPGCVACLIVDDCDDANPCTQDSCGADFTCSWDCYEGAQCDDDDPYTIEDICTESETGNCTCTGFEIDCLEDDDCDDGNECTDDMCYVQQCWHDCLDGLDCATGDGGVCRFFPESLDCVCLSGCKGDEGCVDENPCTHDWCDSDGVCHSDCLDGLQCDDGDPDTGQDVCLLEAGGECSCRGESFVCESDNDCDDDNTCTTDICTPSGCEHDCLWYESCDDGDVSTTDECCRTDPDTGGCECLGLIASCDTDGDCNDMNDCTADSCNMGECSYQCTTGKACDDGDPGTEHDQCGHNTVACHLCACQGEPPCSSDEDCDDGNQCTQDSCGESGECVNSCLMDSNCDDGDPSSLGDSCRPVYIAGEMGCECKGDTPCIQDEDCTDDNLCTSDLCEDTGWCKTVCDGIIECDDQDPFTLDTVCEWSIILGCICTGPRVHCLDALDCDDGNDCTLDTCNPQGECSHACQPGLACDDNNPFSTADSCRFEDGACTCKGDLECSDDADCDDTDPCTHDWCDVKGECHQDCLDNLPCDDGDPLTKWDSCSVSPSDSCLCSGTVVSCLDAFDCNDDNECTSDFCYNFSCLYDCRESEQCDDGNPYTIDDTCISSPDGGCPCEGDGIDCLLDGECDDQNPCTADVCTDGFCNNDCLEGQGCDDGNPYTDPDTCEAVPGEGCVCQGPGFDCLYDHECEDQDQCTVDVCFEGFCENNCSVGLACDDSDPASENDKCLKDVETDECLCRGNTGCQTDGDCDDCFKCTSDECDLDGNCQYACLGATPCDDGNPNTSYDACKSSPTGDCICAGKSN